MTENTPKKEMSLQSILILSLVIGIGLIGIILALIYYTDIIHPTLMKTCIKWGHAKVCLGMVLYGFALISFLAFFMLLASSANKKEEEKT